jgi:hypothetical protein
MFGKKFKNTSLTFFTLYIERAKTHFKRKFKNDVFLKKILFGFKSFISQPNFKHARSFYFLGQISNMLLGYPNLG